MAMAETKTIKLSDSDFATFRDYVYFWQRELGLMDWKVYVFNEEGEPDAFASTS